MSTLLKFEDIEVGTNETTNRLITKEDAHQFGHLSGDLNPLHMDDEFAAQTPFKRRVVHGMFIAALISTTHTNLTGPGYVYVGQELNFKGPVYIEDTVTITVTVIKKKERKGILALETVVTNQDEKVVLEGRSALMELKKLEQRRSH